MAPSLSAAWHKPIPPARDRLQSQLLTFLFTPVLLALNLQAANFALHAPHAVAILYLEALAISIFFAAAVSALRAATPAAALLGALICLLLTFYTGSPRPTVALTNPLHSALTPLIELFILTFAATRAGRIRKQRAGLAEPRRGRAASQILANLGLAGVLSSILGALAIQWISFHTHRFLFIPRVLPILVLAALAEATADTVSSEFGQAFGGQPILLTTLRRVPPGTDGAITLAGTAAGLVTSGLIVLVGIWALRMTHMDVSFMPNLSLAPSGSGFPYADPLTAFAAGAAGLFFDSLLGATVERKGWLGNDLVNLSSTLFAAATALLILIARTH